MIRTFTKRRPRSARRLQRPQPRIACEALESRVMLSAVSVGGEGQAAVAASAHATLDTSLASISDVVVNSVEVVDGQLVANTTIVGAVLGRDFTENVQIPLNLGTTDTGGDCPILNLSLGPVHLDVLGLNVDLDNCDGGAVTVDITAVPGEGNLLGNLLCDVANLLNDGGVLGDLTGEQLSGLTGALTEVLNSVLGGLTGSSDILDPPGNGGGNGNGNGVGNGNGRSRTTDILSLEVGALDLDVLGLQVETSDICLNVSAERGSGNLLGNLLSSVVHLADRPGNPLDAIFSRIDRLDRILDRL